MTRKIVNNWDPQIVPNKSKAGEKQSSAKGLKQIIFPEWGTEKGLAHFIFLTFFPNSRTTMSCMRWPLPRLPQDHVPACCSHYWSDIRMVPNVDAPQVLIRTASLVVRPRQVMKVHTLWALLILLLTHHHRTFTWPMHAFNGPPMEAFSGMHPLDASYQFHLVLVGYFQSNDYLFFIRTQIHRAVVAWRLLHFKTIFVGSSWVER